MVIGGAELTFCGQAAVDVEVIVVVAEDVPEVMLAVVELVVSVLVLVTLVVVP